VFGMSFGEMMVVVVLALLVVGPQNLPKVARSMGRAYAWMRHHLAMIQREINLEMRRIELEEAERKVGPNVAPPPKSPPYDSTEPPADAAPPAVDLSTTGNDQPGPPAQPEDAAAAPPRDEGPTT
jgi:sec-independent protein translocase protein TatB